MNILAQCGYGPSDKLIKGFESGCINGVVFSPRYMKPEKLREFVEELKDDNRQLLMDPEFFATDLLKQPVAKLGSLEEWSCFRSCKRSDLISGTAISRIIESCVNVQVEAGLDGYVTPNVYVNTADSINAGIAFNFVMKAKEITDRIGVNPTFATLAFDRDVFLCGESFKDTIDAFTGIDNPPDGYYLIVGTTGTSNNVVRSDLYAPQVIAGLMYTNYALSINGAQIINGYCHLLSALLGICGAKGAASGWHSGLRQFSMNRYSGDISGGRTPLIRYVSTSLLSHITYNDFLNFREVVPHIFINEEQNTMHHNQGEEPSRTEEALQSWGALNQLSNEAISGNIHNDLKNFKKRVEKAIIYWLEIRGAGFSKDTEANIERLEAIIRGIELFTRLAELA